MIPTFGPMELVILLVIVLVVFGGGKLAGVGKSLGTAINEFKGAVTTDKKDDDTDSAPAEKVEKTETAEEESE